MSDQHAYMTALRLALNQRTGRSWSLRPGRGTSHDRILITAPPDRKEDRFGTAMNAQDRRELAAIFGLPIDTVIDMVVVMPDQRRRYLAKVMDLE
jgi:hypothetical protein